MEIYATVGPAVMICQLLAVLEIIHPLLGWVRTGVVMPIMQVGVNVTTASLLYFYFAKRLFAFFVELSN